MTEFEYTVQDQLGIHARPAGQIAKLAKAHPDCEISFAKIGGSKTANAARVMALDTIIRIKCFIEHNHLLEIVKTLTSIFRLFFCKMHSIFGGDIDVCRIKKLLPVFFIKILSHL